MICMTKKIQSFLTAFCLAAALLSPAVCGESVRAAEPVMMNWHDGTQETAMTVEAGVKFFIGDFVQIYSGSMAATATLVEASYQIKDQGVASVSGKGFLSAKKPGMTDVTVSYQGKSFLCHLTVEKKGTFEKSDAIDALKDAAKTLAKGMPSSLTAAKGYALKKKRDEYLALYGMNSSAKLAYDGFLYEQERPSPRKPDYPRSEKLAVPEAGRYLTAEALLRQFRITYDPTAADSKNKMQIASVTAGGKAGKIRIRLEGKIGAEQILAAQLAYPYENGQLDSSPSKAGLVLSVYDKTAGIYYKAQMTLKKGSSQIDAVLMTSGYGGLRQAEFVKGHVYMMGSKNNWGGGKEVTADS